MTLEKVYKPLAISVLKRFLSSIPAGIDPREKFKNILVVRQHDQLGDMILATPMLHALRTTYPAAFISLVTSPVNDRIMLNHPDVDEVICYDKNSLWTFYRQLRSRNYDLAIVPTTVSLSATSDIIARLSNARVRIGPRQLLHRTNQTAFCFTNPVDLSWDATPRRHQSLRNLDILKGFGLTEEGSTSTIGLTESEKMAAQESLAPPRKKFKLLLGIHPGAGHPENRWHVDRYAEIAKQFANEYNAGIVITSGPMDREVLSSIEGKITPEHLIVKDKSIREVAAIINELDMFVTNDTGIMHVAGAVNTNLLALFGPSDPLQWAPIGAKNRFITGREKSMDSLGMEEVYSILRIIALEIAKK
ncbi:MAG TPA: glycosyltransferase family 9 protein [Bacteroidota bacterium]|nr:glycosyltransferase family 9 protein [Bacteroidota bacterium]